MKFENGPCEEAEVCLFLPSTSSALDWKHLRVNVALFSKALLKFGKMMSRFGGDRERELQLKLAGSLESGDVISTYKLVTC